MAAGTMIYDGDCGFCTTCALWLDRRGNCEIQPWQTTDLDSLDLSVEQVTTSVWWIGSQSQGHPTKLSGAAAVAAALHSCGLPLSLLGRFIDLPGVRLVAERVYRFVANNRHRLPGSTCAY